MSYREASLLKTSWTLTLVCWGQNPAWNYSWNPPWHESVSTLYPKFASACERSEKEIFLKMEKE